MDPEVIAILTTCAVALGVGLTRGIQLVQERRESKRPPPLPSPADQSGGYVMPPLPSPAASEIAAKFDRVSTAHYALERRVDTVQNSVLRNAESMSRLEGQIVRLELELEKAREQMHALTMQLAIVTTQLRKIA